MGEEQVERIKCLIIGSGPSGYTAAIYTARADLKPVLYTGLCRRAADKNNRCRELSWLPQWHNGAEMMGDFHKQASRMGADLRIGYVSAVDFSRPPYKVTIDEKKAVLADAVIIATGATPKWLGLESEMKYAGLRRFGLCNL